MKMPALQFYPGDWRKDPAVQALGYFERGVWFEILCIMHESSERGVLLLNDLPMPNEALANVLGLDNQIVTTCLTKLVDYGVAKRRESDGAIYSKRMVRDEELCKVRRECGKLGGNPNLLNQNKTTGVKQVPTPSSSSSSSSSKENTYARTEKKPSVHAVGFDLQTGTFSGLNGQMQIWKEAYPAISVETEIKKAAAWLVANPKNRKSNYTRFLNSWFSRAQDKAPAKGKPDSEKWKDS